ncbi:MAG: hypothetical protein ACR2O3_10455 [Rhizobiaceae bacterium]
MSTVIKFPLEKVQRRSQSASQNTDPAKILVFQGVQYLNREGSDESVLPDKKPTTTRNRH